MANALESRNSSRFGLLHSSVIVMSSGNPCLMRIDLLPKSMQLHFKPSSLLSLKL